MSQAVATPLDVKLMNATAAVLFMGCALVGLLAAFNWAMRLHAFDIHTITITGEVTHNNARTLRANIVPRIAGTFFTVDLAQVREAFEAVPWVRSAVVRRTFPGTLRVELQEHQAVAFWGDDAEQRLINSYGEVFEANVGEVEQDGLPQLSGPDEQSKEVLTMYQTLAPMFAQIDLEVEMLEISDRGSWRAGLAQGASVELGRGNVDEIAARLRRFLTTLSQVTPRYSRRADALQSADLRYESGYAIRLHGVSTQTAAVTKK
jgi:cell division protein FtsQ